MRAVMLGAAMLLTLAAGTVSAAGPSTPMEVVYEMTTSMGVANSRQPRPMFHR